MTDRWVENMIKQLGYMSAEQTSELFAAVVEQMTEEQLIAALDHKLPKELKGELAEAWKEE